MDAPQTGSRWKNKTLVGRVVANNDPSGCQRVRIRLPEVYDDVPDTALPWAIPKYMPLGVGQGGGASAMCVPVVGSLLYVELQEGDPHFPVYVGAPSPASVLNPKLKTNYPSRYGYFDPQGNGWYVDMKTNDAEWVHHSGTSFHVSPDGSVTQTIKGAWTVKVAGAIKWETPAAASLTCATFDVI